MEYRISVRHGRELVHFLGRASNPMRPSLVFPQNYRPELVLKPIDSAHCDGEAEANFRIEPTHMVYAQFSVQQGSVLCLKALAARLRVRRDRPENIRACKFGPNGSTLDNPSRCGNEHHDEARVICGWHELSFRRRGQFSEFGYRAEYRQV